MKKYVALLISVLLTVIVVQWFMATGLRSENQLLREKRDESEQQSRSELEQALQTVKQQQTEAESLRSEVARLRGEAQRVRQALQGATVSKNPTAFAPTTSVASDPTHPEVALTDRNRALLEYIGEPVEAPANTDVKYTKEGVISAVQLAAQNAGVSLKGLEIEDSEYPFLVGVLCESQVYGKLLDEIKKLDGYGYNGGVGGSDMYHVVNITPTRAYPNDVTDQASRRLMLREQVFYKKLSSAR